MAAARLEPTPASQPCRWAPLAPAAPPAAGCADPARERAEIATLLEEVHRRCGLDFRSYAYASVRRRTWRRVRAEGLATVGALRERVLHDPQALERLLADLSINVTAMFRDPSFFRAIRQQVVPWLRSLPFIRVWHAGCSTGEEVLSMAILLAEEGLLDRARIYATDMNEAVLRRARRGILPLERMQEYTDSYQRSGGTRAFSEYYTARYGGALFDPRLLRQVVFGRHNLATDRSFGEFQLILCRNVLIYFDRSLQARVHALFHHSLAGSAYLGLGARESLRCSEYGACYEAVDMTHKLYRKVR